MCFTCVCPHGTSGLIRSSLCLNIHSTDWWAEPSSWYKTSWHSSHELCVFWLEGRPSGLSLWFECGAVGGRKGGAGGHPHSACGCDNNRDNSNRAVLQPQWKHWDIMHTHTHTQGMGRADTCVHGLQSECKLILSGIAYLTKPVRMILAALIN